MKSTKDWEGRSKTLYSQMRWSSMLERPKESTKDATRTTSKWVKQGYRA